MQEKEYGKISNALDEESTNEENGYSFNENNSSESNSSNNDRSSNTSNTDDSNNSENSNEQNTQPLGTSPKPYKRSDDELLEDGKEKLEQNVKNSKAEVQNAKTDGEMKSAMSNYSTAVDEYNRYQKITKSSPQLSTSKILKAHVSKATNLDTNFVFKHFSKGKGVSGFAKSFFKFAKDNASATYHGIYGNKVRNVETGKIENDGSGYYNNFRPTNLLGLTNEDKKMLKTQMGLVTGTFGGMASLFMGMSTLIAHPTVGMGLLASGAVLTHKGLGRSTSISTYKGKYAFSRFGIPTIKNMQKEAIKKAKKERNYLMLESIKFRHPHFYKLAKLGKISVAPIGKLTTGAIVPLAMTPYRFMSKTNIGQGFTDLKDHWVKQQQVQEKEFKKDALNVLNAETQARMSYMLDEDNQKSDSEEKMYMKRLYNSMGFDYDEKTGHLTVKANISEDQKTQEEFENKLDEKLKNNGIEDTIVERNINTNRHLTDSEISLIDKEIDNILISMSCGKNLDMDSEKTLNEATKKLTDKLVLSGVISEDSSASEVFVAGKNGLKRALKQKAKLVNTKLEIAEQDLNGINDEDKELIKEAISEISSNREVSDYRQITAEEILNIVNTNRVNPKPRNKENPKSKKISKKPPLTDREKQDYSKKVVAYLVSLETAKKATHNSEYKEKQKARRKVKDSVKRRKTKLKQVLEMSFSTDIEDATGDLIEQVNNIKETGGVITNSEGQSLEISSEESNKVLEMLFLRKELEEINNVAVEELEISRGSQRFNQAKKAKSDATVDYYKQELEIKRYAQENSEIYADANYEERTNYYTEDQINERKRIEQLEKTLGQKKKFKEKAEREVIMNGPIVDLNQVRRNLLNK